MSSTKAAFIGLGNMGYPMAGHLAKADFAVTVYNRTAAKAEAWVKEYGIKKAVIIHDAEDCEILEARKALYTVRGKEVKA